MGLLDRLFQGSGTTQPRQEPELFGRPIEEEIAERISNPAYLVLLSTFLAPNEPTGARLQYLSDALGKPVAVAIDDLIRSEMLVEASILQRLECRSAVDLRTLAKERKIKVSGTKSELVQRLAQADPQGMEALVTDKRLLICSEAGRQRVLDFRNQVRQEREKAQSQCFESLLAGDLTQACMQMIAFEAGQPVGRGIGIDWKHRDIDDDVAFLRTLYASKPAILGELDGTDLAGLHIAAAMMHLWGTDDVGNWLPTDLANRLRLGPATSARMMIFDVRDQLERQKYARLGMQRMRLLACPGSCSVCLEAAKRRYTLADAPRLPHAGCTNEMGCRCILMQED